MSTRRSLGPPITLAIFMIVLLVALAVGWVLLAVFGALGDAEQAGLYWTLLSVGATFFVLVLVGTVMYLSLSIKAINLTRRQSNFVDSVTHELKSPIASLKLYLQTLSRRQVSEQKQERFYHFMLEDVERLDHLINHLLDAARLEKRPVEEDIEKVDLARLLAECAQTVCLRYRVPPESVRLDVQPCSLAARRVDMDMIFRNLIDNAVKYGGEQPHVQITLELMEGQKGLVRISDNGPGIPHPLRRKIFGRFVRLGTELERKRPGTGLGLYIVRTLIRRLRGTIHVRDPVAGPGTVFEVVLPGVTPEPPAELSPPDANGSRKPAVPTVSPPNAPQPAAQP
jgi:signal transduction histidine kinase